MAACINANSKIIIYRLTRKNVIYRLAAKTREVRRSPAKINTERSLVTLSGRTRCSRLTVEQPADGESRASAGRENNYSCYGI